MVKNDFDLNFYSNYGAPYDPHTFLNIVSVDGFGFSDALSNLPVKQQLDQQIKEVFASTDDKQRKRTIQLYLTDIAGSSSNRADFLY
ncbi:hypothetical protein GCM10020331_081670 [Ectobacillus funiculus]